ncbi:MAG: type II secretion system F family protein [Rhodospirillales bacterium]|nr:type II secretion system F family protein [Rhodospirillales bacterium]
MTFEIGIIFVGVLMALLAIAVAIGSSMSPEAQVRKRAHRLVKGELGRSSPTSPTSVGDGSILRTQSQGIKGLEDLAKRLMPRQANLTSRLRRTGFDITLGTYLFCNVLLGAIVFGVGAFVFGYSMTLSGLVAVFLGLGLPHMGIGFLIGRRVKNFLAVFPEGIELIVRGLKSGLPVSESMAVVGREIPDPVGLEFRTIMDNVKFGQKLDETLWQTAARLEIPEFNFFVISLSIQQETGGNLAETLANLGDILRKRRQMKLKVKALSGEARASAYILGSLPFIMFALVNLLNPGYASELFNDPRGMAMVGAGIASMGMGIAVMAKLVRFEI